MAHGHSVHTACLLTQPLREGDSFPGFDELRRRAELYGESLLAIVEQFNPEQVLHLPYEGQFYDVPAILVLIQAINYAADHRSQVATMLSQQGITLPELNSWAYYHEVIRPESGG